MICTQPTSGKWRVLIPQNIGKTSEVYRVAVPRCFAQLTPNYRQCVGYSLIYLSIQSLLEYTVRFCNYRHLQSAQNVHASMEAGVFLRKCTPVIASSAVNLIAFLA